MGAYAAGAMGWGTLPRPHIGNRRARFYFTEAGWHKIGRAVLVDAHRRGIMVRVVRLKNPPLSQAIYRDKWQVAILPPGGEENVADRQNDAAYLRSVPLLKIADVGSAKDASGDNEVAKLRDGSPCVGTV
jgi:hypothetical protein